jgi:excisionase family DNA binding protein
VTASALMTDIEASKVLHVSRAKFHQLVARGMIPRLKIDRSARYRVEDVEAFIRELTEKAKP